jgi:uncharacterized protein (DUF302 family)
MMHPEIREFPVQRWSVTSSRPFDSVAEALAAAIGHPDLAAFTKDTAAAKTLDELETVIQKVLGQSGFMEFARFDLGAILKKESGRGPRIYRFVIGNPLIMKEMVKHVPDAGSYAPVTILIDERPDGVHLSYDRMASFLGSYANPAALQVARDLDSKVEALLTGVAR